MTGYDHGCALCGLAVRSFDEFAGHVDDGHPHTDYVDALVELRDGAPIGHDGAGSAPSLAVQALSGHVR